MNKKNLSNHLRKELSIELIIPEEEIILTNSQRGSYEIQVILFETIYFNDTKLLNIDKCKSKCLNDKNYVNLKRSKKV